MRTSAQEIQRQMSMATALDEKTLEKYKGTDAFYTHFLAQGPISPSNQTALLDKAQEAIKEGLPVNMAEQGRPQYDPIYRHMNQMPPQVKKENHKFDSVS